MVPEKCSGQAGQMDVTPSNQLQAVYHCHGTIAFVTKSREISQCSILIFQNEIPSTFKTLHFDPNPISIGHHSGCRVMKILKSSKQC